MRFLRNLKEHKLICALIIVVLFIQAMCELALPNYTSDLIDTGLTNAGIEYGIPEKITAESYEVIADYMSKEELDIWRNSYDESSDGAYLLKDTSSKNMKELEDKLERAIVVAYMMESMSQNQPGDEGMTIDKIARYMPEGLMQQYYNGEITQEELFAKVFSTMKEQTQNMLDQMGDTIVHSSAVRFVKNEYEKVGIDVDSMQISYLFTMGAKMLGMALAMTLAAIVVGFLSAKVAASIGKNLRERLFKKVVSFSEAEMKKFSTASLITRSTNDIQQVQMVTVMLLRMVFYAPIVAIGGIIMVIRTSSGMEWIIVIAVATILLLVAILMIVAMPKFKIMQNLVDRVNLVAREILTGIPVIRAFTREKREEERFDEANKNLTKVMLFTNRVMTVMMPAMMFVMNGVSILIIWTSAHRINDGTIEVGTMTAFITYTMVIVMSFLMITMMSIMLPRAAVASDRIDEVLNTEPSIVDKDETKSLTDVKGVVSFNDVSFSYPDAEGYVLENVSFTAMPGKTTAVIGSTGSGKSTLVQLIARFYDVTKGSITIDGVDIRDVKQKSLRDIIGYVPQKGVLFSGTIESNILYGAADKSSDNMIAAATVAQATEFINDKDEKYETSISQGGTNVSGGQKQRLSIARAIAKKPLIYIFDDSFSALDFKTDAVLRKALAPIVKDSTVFIVAQRISTILSADQIIVLDDGNVAGIGKHKELMKNCEVYRQIAESQLSPEEIENSIKDGKEEV